MTAWLDDVVADTGFGAANLPYGVFSDADGVRRVGVALGAYVIDVSAVLGDGVFARPTLNAFLERGRDAWRDARGRLQDAVTAPMAAERIGPHLHALADLTLHLPFDVADYVDFYASIDHATNLGRIFRPDSEPLTPNWRHLPIGYHGRAGTVIVSGTDVVRPSGLRMLPGAEAPTYGPSRKLDLEVEVGFLVGTGSRLGRPVPADRFADHVFGAVLVNDWSARDIQAFEYVPLGPFLGKSFATSVSPWVVPLDALAPARVPAPAQAPAPADYLRTRDAWALDIGLELVINDCPVSRPPFRAMYWTAPQQMAHITANGATLRTGDLFASGTVSGPEPGERGSLIELSWNGQQPIQLADGSTRTFLEDGDVVEIRGTAPGANGEQVSFGTLAGRVLPSP